ncbi:MAG: MBL fold metallo-hydrolase [Desulfovibrio sp.]|jgi:glyoxylase-like metal-dependent hydrolase (beta-lactamase superfamily II)|nr:MBL fold metallo-hydrolase [Desulfovibrio sp.]
MPEEAAPGIYRIEVPLPQNPLKMLNAYLVRGERRHLLVDTGFNRRECKEALFGALDALGVRPGAFDLFITHMHADHCGLAADLAAAPGTVVYAGKVDGESINRLLDGAAFRRFLLRDMARHGCDAGLLKELETKHPGIQYGPSGKVAFTAVGEGDTLVYGASTLRVLLVPGHTPGHMVLFDAQRGILIAGDLILGDITPNISRRPEMPDSLGAYLDSLDKVEKLNAALTLPGHRSLVRDTAKRIGELRAHHARRLAEVRSILEGRTATAAEVAPEMTWSIRGTAWAEFPAPQKWFAINEALAHLDHLAVLGIVVREEAGDLTRFRLSGKAGASGSASFLSP